MTRRWGIALVAACSPLALAGQLVVDNGDLNAATPARLVVTPDGGVTHLTQLRIAALGALRQRGDTLVYDTDSQQLIVRHDISVSGLILEEPLAPVTVGPVTFRGIDALRDAALYEPMRDRFYRSGANRPYLAEQFDFPEQLTFVGDTIPAYAVLASGPNPFQRDTDADGLPDLLDNCVLVANGPSDGATAGVSQYDTDSDGFGNRCDADLNNDCIVNAVDLGLLRAQFFTEGAVDQDFNGDEVVNAVDLGILRTLFFAPPGPSAFASCQ
ncbi:MAG: thrombospondin type 3 repeat-containing protein [Gammaproteobacteria bacterium]